MVVSAVQEVVLVFVGVKSPDILRKPGVFNEINVYEK